MWPVSNRKSTDTDVPVSAACSAGQRGVSAGVRGPGPALCVLVGRGCQAPAGGGPREARSGLGPADQPLNFVGSVPSVSEEVWAPGSERLGLSSLILWLCSHPVHSSPGPLLRERHALFQLLLEGHRRPAQESSQQRPVSPGLGGGAGSRLPAPGVLGAELTLWTRCRYNCPKGPHPLSGRGAQG